MRPVKLPIVTAVVGTLLFAINHVDAIVGGDPINWWKVVAERMLLLSVRMSALGQKRTLLATEYTADYAHFFTRFYLRQHTPITGKTIFLQLPRVKHVTACSCIM